MTRKFLICFLICVCLGAVHSYGAAVDPKRMRAMREKNAQMMAQAQAQQSGAGAASGQPQSGLQQADLEKIVKSLQTSSQVWPKIPDPQTKVMLVSQFIEAYKAHGIQIQKPANYYVAFIDNMASKNPGALSQPFIKLVQVAAIMEYDFDNGGDKDALAQKVLGLTAYQRNKQRLGMK